MLWFKVFKYTSFEPKMSMISKVIVKVGLASSLPSVVLPDLLADLQADAYFPVDVLLHHLWICTSGLACIRGRREGF